MACWRVCRHLSICSLTLLLAPIAAAAQTPGVAISGAPSFANRHSSYAITVTSTAAPFTTPAFSLAASFPDVTFSEPGWSVPCASLSVCTSTRTITVITGNTGGANLTITATGRNGALTATASAHTWIRGGATLAATGATMQTLQAQTMRVTLQTAPPLGVTFQLLLGGPAAAGSSAPSTVTVAPGTTSAVFQLTTGMTAGALTISATTGSPYYTAPGPITLSVVNPSEAPTPAGTNVTVTPPVPSGGTVPVRVTFSLVTAAGFTTLTNITSPPVPPSGYADLSPARQFGLSTTAATSGNVTVCATYPNGAAADETELRLFRFVSGAWVDTTASVDAGANLICGDTGALANAIFAVFRLNSAPDVDPIAGPSSVVAAGSTQQFSATFTDTDAGDTHTGTWVWGDGTTSPATIVEAGGVTTATGEHAFAAGAYQVRLVVSDGGQSAASDDFGVTADGSAPVIASISASPATLWTPDSRMRNVELAVSATDDTGVPVCAIGGVAVEARNVKQTAFTVTGPLAVHLKAFPLTTYIVSVTCTDAIGRTATATVRVQVSK